MRTAEVRSQWPSAKPRIETGDLVLDFAARVLTGDCEPEHLTPIEWGWLRILMLQAGRA
jgi:DNA-binding response OmpR family regulator